MKKASLFVRCMTYHGGCVCFHKFCGFAKVGDFWNQLCIEENVLWFEVSVHNRDFARMNVGHAAGDLEIPTDIRGTQMQQQFHHVCVVRAEIEDSILKIRRQ